MQGIKLYEFTKYISPDGQVFNFSSHSKFIVEESGLGMPTIAYNTQRSPTQHGETVIGYRLNPRTIQYILRENECSRTEYWAARANLLNIVRPNRQSSSGFALGQLAKRFYDGTTRYIDVTVEEGPSFDRTGGGGKWEEFSYQTAVRFFAPDPTWYDPTQSCTQFVLSAESQIIFPITFPIIIDANTIDTTTNITYTGTWSAYPVVVVDGPMTGFQIENETTDKLIKMNYVIADSDRVTIDLRYPTKTVTNIAGDNLIWSLSDDSDISDFYIAPAPEATGGVNTIRVFGAGVDAGSKIELSYYTRYIGI